MVRVAKIVSAIRIIWVMRYIRVSAKILKVIKAGTLIRVLPKLGAERTLPLGRKHLS